jgi:hypothetical protein
MRACVFSIPALRREMWFRSTLTAGGGVAYLQSWSHFIRRGKSGEILFDSRKAGVAPTIPCAQRTQPLPPHTVENLGPSEISIVMVEFKRFL